jgi:hypothetical protein
MEAEQPRRDGTAGDRGDAPELRQIAEVVQPPERAQMEDHRAVAAARETQGDAGLGLPGNVVLRARIDDADRKSSLAGHFALLDTGSDLAGAHSYHTGSRFSLD